MKNMMLKKVLSFLMALVMLFEMVPTSVLHVHAADNLCTHHTHDPAVCSYREEKVCTHTHNDDCYRLTCTHTQCDADCGYLPEDPGADCDCGAAEGEAHTLECAFRAPVPGSLCGHVCSVETLCKSAEPNCGHTEDGSCCYVAARDCDFVCQECLNPQNEEGNNPNPNDGEEGQNDDKQPLVDGESDPECICGEGEKCTADHTKEGCPVCANDITGCKGTVIEEIPEPECNCGEGEKCTADHIKEDCPVCAEDIADCAGTEKEPAKCSCEYQCETAEDGLLCPVCGVEDGWTKCEKEPKPQVELVNGVFGVSWSNRSHSGNMPDLSGDIQVLDGNGALVEAEVSKSETGYSVTSLYSDSTYTLILSPAADADYTVTGSYVMELTYSSDLGCFVGGDFNAKLNTYTFEYIVEWPEGMAAPEDFAPVISLAGSVLSLPQTRTENGFLVSELFQADGEYTLQLPKIDGMTAKRYSIPFDSNTQQPLVIYYGLDELTAEFVIYWNDCEDASGRRTLEEMEDMLTFRTDDGQALTGLHIEGQKQEHSEIDGYEKYIYTVEGITGYTGTSLELIWDSDALLGYNALFTAGDVKLTQGFEPMYLTRSESETCFASELAYAMVLPRYTVKLNVEGLDKHAEECLQPLLDGLTVTRMDLMTEEELPFTAYTVTREGDVITLHGLYANTLEDLGGEYEAMPAYYTVTWPEKLGEFDLSQDSDKSLTVFAQMVEQYDVEDSNNFTANLAIGAPEFAASVSGTETEVKPVLWYDTNNSHDHAGQLELNTTLTINGKTVTLSTTPDTEKGELKLTWDGIKYVYSFADWTAAQFIETFNIPRTEEGHPTDAEIKGYIDSNGEKVKGWLDDLIFTVTDEGVNSMNRKLTASVPAQLKVSKEQFGETNPDYVKYDVTVGEIQVTGVNYTPESDSTEERKYVVGSAVVDGQTYTVLYPLVKVVFNVDVLTGADSLPGAGTADSEFLKLASLIRLQVKNSEGIEDKVLARPYVDENGVSHAGSNYLETLLGLEPGALGGQENYFLGGDLQGANGKYTFLLPLYDPQKIDIEYAMSVLDIGEEDAEDDKIVDIDNPDYWYRVEYNNTPASGHGTDLDRAYVDGKLILIRTGETDFQFNKHWQDGYITGENLTEEQIAENAAIVAARPKATYELWRYSDKTVYNEDGTVKEKGSYKTSANVPVPAGITLEVPTNGANPIQIPEGFTLDKYDNEGYPYVYFVRESMPGNSGYKMVYGTADKDGNVKAGSDKLPKDYIGGTNREAADTGVYDNGNLTNIKTDTITPGVMKTWVGAYYQDRFAELRVTMTLYRRLESEPDAKPENVYSDTIDGFNAYNPTQGIFAPEQELYDANGNKYVYWWEETSVQQGTTDEGNVFHQTPYPTTPPAGLSSMITGDAVKAAAPIMNPTVQTADTETVGEAKQYYLPMNAHTVINDSYSPTSKEYFEVTSYVDDTGVTHFTNTLEGTTEYWVRKTWDQDLIPSPVSFPLLQIDASGKSVQWDNNEDTNPKNNTFTLDPDQYQQGYPVTDQERTHDSGWHKGYVDLPKFDGDGNIYTYIAREGDIENSEPISVYGKDVDEGNGLDGKKEAQSIHVHNAEPGRDFINLRKLWLDDSAYTDRTDVQFMVTAAVDNGTPQLAHVVLYGPGGLYGDCVTLKKDTDWIDTKDVTLYVDESGEYHKYQIGETEPIIPALLAEGDETQDPPAQTPQREKVIVHHYTVTEVSMDGGKAKVQTDSEHLTPADYSTVVYGDTTYAVIYQHEDSNNKLVINPTGTTAKDGDDYYTVTNLRIGTTKLGITKIWYDDGTVLRSGYNARVELQSDTEGLLTSVDGKGYAKVHPAIRQEGRTPVLGGSVANPTTEEEKTHVGLVQNLPTTVASDDTTGTVHHTTYIYFHELPLYDETGKILQYTVEEHSDSVGDTQYTQVSSDLEYEGSNATQYIGLQTIENTYVDTTPVEFHLLWLDEYREDINQRPDMYLKLYYAEYEYEKTENGDLVMEDGVPKVKLGEDGKPVYTLKPYDYREYSWRDATPSEDNEDFWTYTFHDLRNYDAYGRKISYYATVGSLTEMDKVDYLEPQYAIGQVETNSEFQSGANQSNVDPDTLVVTHNKTYEYADSTGLPQDFPIREGEGAVVLQSDNTFVLQLRSNVTVRGRKVWENIPEGFPESDLPLLTFMLKRQVTDEEANNSDSTLSIFNQAVDSEDNKNYVILSAILDYRSPSPDYFFDMNNMGLLKKVGDTFEVIDQDTPNIKYTDDDNNEYTGTALEIWMKIAGIAETNKEEAAALYGQPLPKYDSYGTMYSYKVIDTYVRPDNEGFEEGNKFGVTVNLRTLVNEYKIINSINMPGRGIDVTKNWYRFDKNHPVSDSPDIVYPPLEFQLYRFVRIDNENFEDSSTNPGTEDEKKMSAEYSEPVLVDTKTLTGAQVKAIVTGEDPEKIYATFADQEVYAPNGNPYIYVVAEKKIDGFNTKAGTGTVTVTNVNSFTLDTQVNNRPDFATLKQGYLVSDYFTLTESNAGNTEQGGSTEQGGNTQQVETGKATFDNVYTAMETTVVSFDKEWVDQKNQMKTRPDTLSVTLSRSFTYTANGVKRTRTEKIGTFEIPKNKESNVEVTWATGFQPLTSYKNVTDYSTYKNLTSYETGKSIAVEGGKADYSQEDHWKLTVENLDMYAPNGELYKYSWSEVEVTGYTSVKTANGFKNTLATRLNVFKVWDPGIANLPIAMPKITVELTVSDDNGAKWVDADAYENGAIKKYMGDSFAFEKELDYPYWYNEFLNLPAGYDGKELKYSVKEIKIGDQNVSGSNENGWTITTSDGTETIPTVRVTNKLTTTSLTVTKNWVDDNNVFNTRYINGNGGWEVSYHIYRSTDATLHPDDADDEQLMQAITGERPGTPTPYVLTVTGNDSTSNTASNSISNLPTHDPTGKPYTYYAVELKPDREHGSSVGKPVENNRYDGGDKGAYSVTYKHGSSADGYTSEVENDLHTTNLELTKQWLDDAGYPNVRPGDTDASNFSWETLDITLTQYGGEYGTTGRDITTNYEASAGSDATDFVWKVVTGGDNKWKIVFTDLPKTAPDGTDYTYKVTEVKVPGYQPPTYEGGTAETGGNLSYQVNNTITKFRIEKLGKDNAKATETTPLHNVTLVFEGVAGTATAGYRLEWKSEDNDSAYTESYTITKNGAAWSSGSKENASVDIYGLPEGQYTLTEESVIPEGYYPVAANDKPVFELKTVKGVQTLAESSDYLSTQPVSNNNTLPELEVYNFKTTLLINKQGKTMNGSGTVQNTTGNEDLNGNTDWEFEITGVFADSVNKQSETRKYISANRNAEDLWIGDLIVGETYTLKETKTPDGYTLCTDVITFQIKEDNTVDITSDTAEDRASDGAALTFKNDPFRVTVQKNASGNNGKALSDAEYRLYAVDTNGNFTEVKIGADAIFATGSGGKKLIRSYETTPKLKADNTTKYLLVETKAPAGYILEDVEGPAGYTLPADILSANDSSKTHPWIMFSFTTGGELTGVTTSVQPAISHATVENSGNTAAFTDDPIELYLNKHDNGDVLEDGPIDLDGITFQLKNTSGQVLGEVTTKDGGKIDFADLKMDGSTVLLVGGTDYVLSEKYVEETSNKTGYEHAYYKIGDISFTLRTDGVVDNISVGKQIINGKEVKSDFEATTEDGDRTNTTFNAGNDRKPGKVTLTKKSDKYGDLSDVSFKLYWEKPNTTFLGWLQGFLTGKNYELVWSSTGEGIGKQVTVTKDEGTAGTVGMLTIDNLPWGNYKLVEEEPRNGFLLPQTNEVSFAIGRKQTNVYVTLENKELTNNSFNVTITKKDASVSTTGTVTMGAKLLPGAEFELWQQYGNTGWEPTGYTYTSDAKGVVTVHSIKTDENGNVDKDANGMPVSILIASDPEDDVKKHWYRLVETKAPDGYEFLTPSNATFHDDYVFVDFWVNRENGQVTYTSHGSKKNYVDTGTGTVGNLPIEVILHKYDSGDEYADEKLYTKNVTFTIQEKDEPDTKTSLTMTNGELKIGVNQDNFTLIGGKTYVVTETRVNGFKELGQIEFYVDYDGTVRINSNTAGVTLKDAETNKENIKIVNQREKGKVTLTKKHEGKDFTLNGAEFTLLREDDVENWLNAAWKFITGNTYQLIWSTADGSTKATVGTPTVGKKGELIISGLPWGTYQLVEVKAPEGYKLPAKEEHRIHEFTINDGETNAYIPVDFVSVENAPAEKTFHKRDTNANGAQLPGAVFELKKEGDDTVLKTYTADANGAFTVSSVDADGKVLIQTSEAGEEIYYTLTETTAPNGYELSSTFAKFWVDDVGAFHIDQQANMDDNKVSFLNTPIQLKLVKKDAGDKVNTETKPLAGVTFTVLKSDGTAFTDLASDFNNTTVTTNSDGEATLPTLKLATPDSGTTGIVFPVANETYLLRETRKPGYEQLRDIAFTVNADGNVSNVHFIETANASDKGSVTADDDTITVTNARKLGKVTLTKKDDALNLDLNDAIFELQIEDTADNFVEWLTQLFTGKSYTVIWTNNTPSASKDDPNQAAEGQLIISDLPWGTYRLVEIQPPAGYKLAAGETQIREFTINERNTDQTITLNYVDNDSFSFVFYKYASDGPDANESLAGAEFTLYDANGTALKTYTSDSEGKITVYSVEKATETTRTTLMRVTTNEEAAAGKHVKYTLTETKAPAGYELPATKPSVTFWIDETGNMKDAEYTGTVSYERNDIVFWDKAIELNLIKYHSGDGLTDRNEIPLADVEFQILKKDGTALGVVTTGTDGTVKLAILKDANGTVVFPVAKQKYLLRETKQSGYEQLNDITFTVKEDGTVDAVSFVGDNAKGSVSGTGDTLTVTNVRNLGEVKLVKVGDTEDVKLNGAKFDLYKGDSTTPWITGFETGNSYKVSFENGEVKATGVDATPGELMINDLPWASYRLVETAAPVGYKLPAENLRSHPFTIDASTAEKLKIFDNVKNESFTAEFFKHASANGTTADDATLAGAKFDLVRNSDNVTINTYISGTDGKITLNSIGQTEQTNYLQVTSAADAQAGNYITYTLTETEAPAGYELPSPNPSVKFWFNETGSIQYVEDSHNHVVDNKFLDKPIELMLVKYDGGDRCTDARYSFTDPESFTAFDKLAKLDGITFTLTDAQGNVQTASTDKGIITFGVDEDDDFRVIGGQTYILTEEDTAAIGYNESDPVIFTVNENGTVTLAEGSDTAVTADEEATTLRVVNDRILGTVTLTKRSDDGDALDGVVFHLYREKVPATLLDKLMDFITGKTYTLAGSFVWGEDATEQITQEDGTQVGVLTIRDLDWGSYKLVETYADGYVLDADAATRTYTFEIGPNNAETGAKLDVEIEVSNTPNRLVIQKVGEGETELLTGAQYDLYSIGADGKATKITNTTDPLQPMWKWDSNTGTGEAVRLNSGTYCLVETRSPYGYVIADPMEFTMDQQGNVKLIKGNGRVETKLEVGAPVLVAEDMKTLFQFNKAELFNEYCYEHAMDTRILPGVTFTAYEDAALTKVIGTAVSDEEGVVTFVGLPLKDYKREGTSTPVYIRETATVAGHVLDENVYKVYVESGLNENGQVESYSTLVLGKEELADNTVINDVYRADFTFSKVSELNNLQVIPGAEYGLYKTVQFSAGPIKVDYQILVAKAVSDENGVVIFPGLLMDTEYTVKELSVPSGSYVSENSISFKYTWNNCARLIVLDHGDGTLTAGANGLLWQEPQVVVSILKVNSAKQGLAGATLQIRDKNGKIVPVLDQNGKLVDAWVSTTKAHTVSGILTAGESYYLYELKAPNGYVTSRRQRFTVPSDAMEPGENHVIKVVMVNYLYEEAPKTGDDIMAAVSVMTVSAAELIVLLLLKKKKK